VLIYRHKEILAKWFLAIKWLYIDAKRANPQAGIIFKMKAKIASNLPSTMPISNVPFHKGRRLTG
jgi:hypothetical protein